MGESPAPGHQPTRSRWRIARRIVIITGLVSVALTCVVAATIYVAGNHLIGRIARIPHVFQGMNSATRPSVPARYRQAMTILVVGSDSHSPTAASSNGTGQRFSDALMLVHVNASRRAVAVISIPRNSWVRVPGFGMRSFYQVLDLGGPALLVRTMENLTGVRIDHYMVLDFAGLRGVVQALGGVSVDIPQGGRRDGVTFHEGVNYLGARAAWVYATTASSQAGCRCWQRDGLPGGDLSRMQRQQNLIRAILAKVASSHLLTDPIAGYRLLDALTRAVSVDSTFSDAQMISLALRLAALSGSDVTFLTAPVRSLGWRDHQGVVYLNLAQCASLWNAVRQDSVAAWAAGHQATLTPQVPS